MGFPVKLASQLIVVPSSIQDSIKILSKPIIGDKKREKNHKRLNVLNVFFIRPLFFFYITHAINK